MAISGQDATRAGADDANGIFRSPVGFLADDTAQKLRDYQPGVSFPQLGIGLARAACRRYGANPDALPGPIAAGFERICRPYLDDIGEGEGPRIEQPFRGGQCLDVYLVSYTAVSDFGGTLQATVRALGPIGGVRTRISETGGRLVELLCDNLDAGSTTCGAMGSLGPQWRLLSSFGNAGDPGTARIDGIVPCGNDSCGNVPPVVIQPRPPIIPVPILIPIVLAPDINVDVDVEIDIDGSVNFDIGFGPVTIDPFGDRDGGGGSGGDGPPPAFSEPGPEKPGGNGGFGGDDGFGEPPVGKRWCGACITITVKPEGAGVIPGSVPEDVYPTVVGNIRLIGDSAGGRLIDTSVRILSKYVCLWEPVRGFNPVALSVDLLPGYGYTYRPYAVDKDL